MAIEASELINKVPENERSAFKTKVDQVAARLGISPNWLMAVMDLESGLSPSITNSYGYTGLIQFGADAAREIGTTTSALRAMSRVQQMDYVEKYYRMWMNRLGITRLSDFIDTYLVVFYPTGIKIKNPNTPLTTDKAEVANPYLRGANGDITRNSIRAAYEKRYAGLFEYIVEFTKRNYGWMILGFVLLAIALFALYYELYKGRSVVKLAGSVIHK